MKPSLAVLLCTEGEPVFSPVRFSNSSFSVVFPHQSSIADSVNVISEHLKGHYFTPRIIPIPSEIEPEVPRLIYPSQHGFSQILVSQVNIALNVQYSSDWQKDISLGESYLAERVELVFDLLEQIGVQPLFCGLVTVAHLSVSDEQSLLGLLAERHAAGLPHRNPNDVQIRVTTIIDDGYYSNVTVQNFRAWNTASGTSQVLRRSNQDAIDRGVEVSCDFNDRFSFNEVQGYVSGRETAHVVLSRGTQTIREVISALEAGKW